eukprot:m.333738 g.333738  ORF g.333738 m.333738 type:complete len:267 (-) comp27743_c1_seq12:1866-2666(-)
MPVSLPDSVERWRRLLALVAAGHLTQTMLPPTWVSLVFGRIVTEPIGHLIPASMLTVCTCLSSASMLTFTGLNGEGMKHPFIRKVLSSAGFSYRDANNWLTTLRRHSRYDRACTELHPGEPSCTRALIRAMPRIFGVAVRDIATLYTLLLLRALGTGAPRPPIAPLARTLVFCVTAFSSIRVLSCSACAASLRLPFLNNWLVLNTIFPLWFSLSMLWLKVSGAPERERDGARVPRAPRPCGCVGCGGICMLPLERHGPYLQLETES